MKNGQRYRRKLRQRDYQVWMMETGAWLTPYERSWLRNKGSLPYIPKARKNR